MTTKGKLGPPRGADETRAAMLSSRFSQPEAAASPAAEAPATTAPTRAPAPATAKTPKPPTSRTPAGMVRRSYYLSSATAEQFDQAINQLVESTGGLLPRHEAAAALIAAGTGQVDAVLADVRRRLMANLKGE